MPVLDHIHTYEKWMIKKGHPMIRAGEEQYRCIDPDCTHFTAKSLVKDKRSLCTKCRRNEIILDREALRRVSPLCISCGKTKEGAAMRAAEDMVQDVFKDLDLDGNVVEELKNE